MAVAFVKADSRSNSSGATFRTRGLPSPLTNGDVLLYIVGSKNSATHSMTSGNGWTLLGQVNSGASWTVSIWWGVAGVAGLSDPTVSWSGSVASFSQIIQYSRPNSDTASIIGATLSNTGTGTTHSANAITTTRAGSLVIYIDACAVNTALGTPSGWTENFDNGSATGATQDTGGSKTVASSGSSSGNISVTGGNAAWVMWQIELLDASSGSQQDLFPSLVTRSKTIYAPTVTQPQTLSPSLVTRTKTLYAPTVTAGAVTLSPSLVTQGKTLFAPIVSASYTLAPPLVSRAKTAYSPVVTTTNAVLPGLLTRSKSLYAPTVTVGLVTLLPGLLTRSRTIYAPSVAYGAVTIAPPLISRSKSLFGPVVTRGAVSLLPSLLTRSKTIYAPVVSISTATKDLYPPLVTRGTTQDNNRMWRSFTESFAA